MVFHVDLAGASGHFVDAGECGLFSGLMCRDLGRVPRSKLSVDDIPCKQ